MINFKSIADSDPALAYSPMVTAVVKTFQYIQEHDGIELTPSSAFKRKFVHWAAAEFDWPGYSEADLFALNKVLNEFDFPPVADIHDLLIALKIGRHYKKRFRLTKAGLGLLDQPGRLFGILTPAYLFHFDREQFSRRPVPLLGNWDIFLNVLNVEAENGITTGKLRKTLYGDPEEDRGYDELSGALYVQVLRPLCWTGLLYEEPGNPLRTRDREFTKTPLWAAALRLETDDMVEPATRH